MRALTRRGWMPFSILILLFLTTSLAWGANQPCSGKKDGIARCDGDIFLCNDGSISASKRSCAAMFGEQINSARPQSLQQGDEGCQCGSGTFCTGPRGGIYCLTPSGNKSYKRK